MGTPAWLRIGLQIVITFHLVCLGWIFFRADDLTTSMTIVTGLFSSLGKAFLPSSPVVHGLVGLAVLLAVQIVQERRGSARAVVAGMPWPARWALWYALVFGIVLFGVDGAGQFIYFQF
jgi:hypothetical protein